MAKYSRKKLAIIKIRVSQNPHEPTSKFLSSKTKKKAIP